MQKINRDCEVIASNISILNKRLEVTSEQLDISAAQLARAVWESEGKLDADMAYREFCRLFENTDVRAKTAVCRYIVSQSEFSGQLTDKHLFGYGEPALPGTHGKIAYVRNKKNDAAFLSFSERIRSSKAQYCASFNEACENVFNNVCEFCILPVENDTDGVLYSFYAMIDRYELVISDVACVSEDDGAHTTRFALVSRGADAPKAGHLKYRLEFSVVCETSVFPNEIALAAGLLGGSVRTVGTQPAPYGIVGNKYYFSVDMDGEGALAMAFYMSVEYPRYTPLGLYQIKK